MNPDASESKTGPAITGSASERARNVVTGQQPKADLVGPPPRARRRRFTSSLPWICTALALFGITGMIASYRFDLWYTSIGNHVGVYALSSGRLGVMLYPLPPDPVDTPGWKVRKRRTAFRWIPYCLTDGSTHLMLGIPLWIPIAICSAFALGIQVSRHRKPSSLHCVMCGYSRAGLSANALCPECGHAQPSSTLPV
jgi:hypothetical protein